MTCTLLLRSDAAGPSKVIRSKKYWEDNDYYSSDEDTFIDRTGQVERKRLDRIRQLGVEGETAEEAAARVASIEAAGREKNNQNAAALHNASLIKVLAELEKIGGEIVALEDQLREIDEKFAPRSEQPSELDELEAYMDALKSGLPSRKERLKLKSRLFTLRQIEMRLFQKAGLPHPRRRIVAAGGAIAHRNRSVTVNPDVPFVAEEDDDECDDEPTVEKALENKLPEESSEKSDLTSQPAEFPPLRTADTVSSDRLQSKCIQTERPRKPRFTEINNNANPGECPVSGDTGSCLTDPIHLPHVPTDEPQKHENHPIAEVSSDPLSPHNVPPMASPSESGILNKRRKTSHQRADVYAIADPDYVTWLPPSDQQGDGVTALNAKYGY
ncbi:unnamed protein product [Echinostoma caproni]|uniref:Breast cancer susceptibility protein n=1 Tax=Echinostoma caproni TaxID=27848 RepID=A0A183ANR7_9TREM|nr:unnamed protein product [Echinostoma caproni]